MLVQKFDNFLQSVDLKSYRDMYRPIKIVEMDLPKEVQAINALYKVYWDQKKFLSFEDFQAEVRSLYTGKGNVRDWYQKEQTKHNNWPANPSHVKEYQSGWVGWTELFGKENRLKKEFLPFKDFQIEVGNLYPGQGGVQKWYFEEIKRHPHWPWNPQVKYKNMGWISWSALVEKERK